MTARYPELCRFVAVGSTVHPSHKAVAVSLEVRSPSDRRAVTLRRCSDDHQETWLIHYGDVRVGSIATRADVPVDANRWGWSCGIYPNAQDGRTLIDLSGFDCKNDAAAIDKASLLAVGVSLDKPRSILSAISPFAMMRDNRFQPCLFIPRPPKSIPPSEPFLAERDASPTSREPSSVK